MALTCRRTDGLDGNMVVLDSHMRLRFASLGVATLLNYPMRRLGAMRLDELLPAPFDTLHAKWIKVRYEQSVERMCLLKCGRHPADSQVACG